MPFDAGGDRAAVDHREVTSARRVLPAKGDASLDPGVAPGPDTCSVVTRSSPPHRLRVSRGSAPTCRSQLILAAKAPALLRNAFSSVALRTPASCPATAELTPQSLDIPR